MSNSTLERRTCACCGVVLPPGIDACQELVNQAIATEQSDPAFAEVFLLRIDAYILQHSEEHGPRSNAFHLMRLCWMLEFGGSAVPGGSTLPNRKKFEEAYRLFPFLQPPADRGSLTIAEVLGASDAADYQRWVRNWAQSVWDAWEDAHAWARDTARRLMIP